MSRIKIDENHYSSATQQSAEEDSNDFIHLTEKLISLLKNQQIIFIKSHQYKVGKSITFGNSITIIHYDEMTNKKTKQFLHDYFIYKNIICIS